jgi:hypothetical protein
VVSAAVESLKTAAGEYQQAIVGGRIGKLVEYRTRAASSCRRSGMIDGVAPEFEEMDACRAARRSQWICRIEEGISLPRSAASAGQGPRRDAQRRVAHRACRRQANVRR